MASLSSTMLTKFFASAARPLPFGLFRLLTMAVPAGEAQETMMALLT